MGIDRTEPWFGSNFSNPSGLHRQRHTFLLSFRFLGSLFSTRRGHLGSGTTQNALQDHNESLNDKSHSFVLSYVERLSDFIQFFGIKLQTFPR